MNELTFNFNKLYPNRVIKNTSDSDIIKQMEISREIIHKHGGISFYCRKRREYVYIPNTKIN